MPFFALFLVAASVGQIAAIEYHGNHLWDTEAAGADTHDSWMPRSNANTMRMFRNSGNIFSRYSQKLHALDKAAPSPRDPYAPFQQVAASMPQPLKPQVRQQPQFYSTPVDNEVRQHFAEDLKVTLKPEEVRVSSSSMSAPFAPAPLGGMSEMPPNFVPEPPQYFASSPPAQQNFASDMAPPSQNFASALPPPQNFAAPLQQQPLLPVAIADSAMDNSLVDPAMVADGVMGQPGNAPDASQAPSLGSSWGPIPSSPIMFSNGNGNVQAPFAPRSQGDPVVSHLSDVVHGFEELRMRRQASMGTPAASQASFGAMPESSVPSMPVSQGAWYGKQVRDPIMNTPVMDLPANTGSFYPAMPAGASQLSQPVLMPTASFANTAPQIPIRPLDNLFAGPPMHAQTNSMQGVPERLPDQQGLAMPMAPTLQRALNDERKSFPDGPLVPPSMGMLAAPTLPQKFLAPAVKPADTKPAGRPMMPAAAPLVAVSPPIPPLAAAPVAQMSKLDMLKPSTTSMVSPVATMPKASLPMVAAAMPQASVQSLAANAASAAAASASAAAMAATVASMPVIAPVSAQPSAPKPASSPSIEKMQEMYKEAESEIAALKKQQQQPAPPVVVVRQADGQQTDGQRVAAVVAPAHARTAAVKQASKPMKAAAAKPAATPPVSRHARGRRPPCKKGEVQHPSGGLVVAKTEDRALLAALQGDMPDVDVLETPPMQDCEPEDQGPELRESHVREAMAVSKPVDLVAPIVPAPGSADNIVAVQPAQRPKVKESAGAFASQEAARLDAQNEAMLHKLTKDVSSYQQSVSQATSVDASLLQQFDLLQAGGDDLMTD